MTLKAALYEARGAWRGDKSNLAHLPGDD